MKQHLYTKLLILYFMLGGICFLLLSSGGSYLVEKRLERSTGESLYRTASQLVSKNELRQAVKNPKKESLTLALSSAAAFQNADFWVMDTDGNVLINTNQQSSDSDDITVRNFRPEDYEDACYSSGTFYGTLKTSQLSTVVPIKDTDLVTVPQLPRPAFSQALLAFPSYPVQLHLPQWLRRIPALRLSPDCEGR